MQPPEPASSETSLQLPVADEVAPPPSTELVLPAASPPPVAPQPSVEPGPRPGPLGDLVVAHFRRVETAMLARVLITTLGGALPASVVRVERRRSLGRRLTGRAGEPIGISVTSGERTLTFRAPQLGVVEASIGHTVRGVVLSSTAVPLAPWFDELSDLLDGLTRSDEETRAALEQALGG